MPSVSTWRPIAPCLHAYEYAFLTFFMHFITYLWILSLLWKKYLQIVWLSGFLSGAFGKHLTSHCSMLPCPWICIPHFFFYISSLIGHCCVDITFKLSENRDFLQVPSGSNWRAIAACFHTHENAFLTFFCRHHVLVSHCCGEITFIVRQSGFPSGAFGKHLTSHCSMLHV